MYNIMGELDNKNIIKSGLVIMASGQSKRFGSNKLMADLNGKPMIEYILTASDGLFDSRVIVTRNEDVVKYCEKRNANSSHKVTVVLHQYEDRNDVVRMGVEAIEKSDNSQFCVFVVADQPLILSSSLHKMIKTQKKELSQDRETILKACYKDKIGNPMCFPASMYAELKTLPPKKGGNFLAQKYADKVKYIEVCDQYELFDIDTVEDLEQIERFIIKKEYEDNMCTQNNNLR